MNELDKLRPEVREALWHIRPASRARFQLKSWETIRAELLRLAVRNAELEAKATRDHEWFHDLLTENEKAEAELAALKARIDALMLEFCPDDMTEEQCAAWAARQQVVEE